MHLGCIHSQCNRDRNQTLEGLGFPAVLEDPRDPSDTDCVRIYNCSLPPPPSYEEAQGLQISAPRNSSANDNEDTPASMPLLGATGGSGATAGPQNQNLGQMGVFPPSTVAVSANTGTTSYTNVTAGTTVDVPSVMGTSTPTSIPIPPGHVPIITCHSCGARQQIGQYSFLPKTQVVSMQANVGSMNFYSPQPPGSEITAPNYMIAAGQQPGYPSSLPASGVVPSQQQCNVAVHYNSNQGTVQSQLINAASQNGSESEGRRCKAQDCALLCCLIIFTTFVVVVSLVAVQYD
ncbi:uncharacterized protein LOC110442913 isoform X3 [Mizuhopecten yessoensis]|uniref:uncharacterized protein LOC110442913 isoform X3 n=1 Tax=Mizuhopecten yessoensis TaxID=6573 RepID=UPI000B4595B6|nr:uncharacterized protein LOC110442913 isoform X3 [Mizuhopecten yessoensis]